MKRKPPVCHAMPITPCQAPRTIAPCKAVIRPASANDRGDSFSGSLRFIDCPKCRAIVEAATAPS